MQKKSTKKRGASKAPKKQSAARKPTGEESKIDAIRARAQAMIKDPAIKTGHQFRVEEILAAEKWEDLEEMMDAIEKGHSYAAVMARNDKRTLSEETVEALCVELAGHLEDFHLIGYLFALLEHLSAAAQSMDVKNVIYAMRRHFLANNGHGSDEAAESLRVSALAALGKADAESEGENDN